MVTEPNAAQSEWLAKVRDIGGAELTMDELTVVKESVTTVLSRLAGAGAKKSVRDQLATVEKMQGSTGTSKFEELLNLGLDSLIADGGSTPPA